MKTFIAGMATMVIILTAVMYVLDLQNDKLKIENDRLQAQQDFYTQQAIENQNRQMFDEISDALSQYDSYNTTSDSR